MPKPGMSWTSSTADTLNRGDVYLARHNPVEGSEQGGIRPIVIVSRDSLNRSRGHVLTVPFTRTVLPRPLSTHVTVEARSGGLRTTSVARAEHCRVLAKSRLLEFWGSLDAQTMSRIDDALRVALNL